MAYSATSRIIHKSFINVNPLVQHFGDIFRYSLADFLPRIQIENWV